MIGIFKKILLVLLIVSNGAMLSALTMPPGTVPGLTATVWDVMYGEGSVNGITIAPWLFASWSIVHICWQVVVLGLIGLFQDSWSIAKGADDEYDTMIANATLVTLVFTNIILSFIGSNNISILGLVVAFLAKNFAFGFYCYTGTVAKHGIMSSAFLRLAVSITDIWFSYWFAFNVVAFFELGPIVSRLILAAVLCPIFSAAGYFKDRCTLAALLTFVAGVVSYQYAN